MTAKNEGLSLIGITEVLKHYFSDAIGKESGEDIAEEILAKANKLGWMSPDECQECQAQTECKIEKQTNIKWIKALMRGGIMVSKPEQLEGVGDRIAKQERERIGEWLEFHRKTGHLNKLVVENLLIPALKQGELPEK